jgi:cytochrome c biogenesis protein CcmG/thiol:disulfide interchange protein DsbE
MDHRAERGRRLAIALGVLIVIVAAVRISTIPLDAPAAGGVGPRTSAGTSDLPASGLGIGLAAPDFVDAADPGRALLVDLEGKRVRLGDFAGRPLWIVFWATWCVPCQQEASDILALYHEHSGDGLAVLAIDEQEPAAAVRDYAQDHSLDYAIGLDPTAAVKTLYGGVGLPTHLFLDGAGVIQDRYIGQMTRELMERRLETIIPGSTSRSSVSDPT